MARMGIKDEAVGKYYYFGEKIIELAVEIEKLTSDFQVLYEHNIHVWKMHDIAKRIKELSNQLEYCIEKIAVSCITSPPKKKTFKDIVDKMVSKKQDVK
jgi:hypothetical protein